MHYGTTVGGDTYFNDKLHFQAWDEATEDERERALTEASVRIDLLSFRGSKTSSDQELEFPRDGSLVIPTKIVNAAYEIAFALLDGSDPDLANENLAISSDGYSSVRATYERRIAPEYAVAGIPSRLAYLFLKPYLTDPREIKVRRA